MFQVYYFDLNADKFIKYSAPCADEKAVEKLDMLRKQGNRICHAKKTGEIK